MATANIAEVLKLAAKLVQYDNDEKTWLEFLPSSRTISPWWMRGTWALLLNAESQPVANLPTGTDKQAVDHPNVESHTVRLVGDTDHWTKLETGAKSCRTETVSKRGDRWWPRTR